MMGEGSGQRSPSAQLEGQGQLLEGMPPRTLDASQYYHSTPCQIEEFISSISQLAALISQLTAGTCAASITLNEEQKKAVESLKEALTTSPCLVLFNDLTQATLQKDGQTCPLTIAL